MGKREQARQCQVRGGIIQAAAVFLWLTSLLASPVALGAPAVRVLQVRYFTGPEHTRIVMDLSDPCSFEVREVSDPPRLAVNVRRGRFEKATPQTVDDGLVRAVRCNNGPTRAQMVIDLVGKTPFKSFSLPAGPDRPHRVVVDIFRPLAQRSLPVAAAPEEPAVIAEPGPKPFTVIIDPGHGGLDPGAIRQGVQEKDIVLEVAREMARLIGDLPGYRAVLTRAGDYYPSLGRRVELASEKDGDLFLSVHCNTHRNTKLSGMEVYFLSLQGATDREARELADKENAADVVGLGALARPTDMVMNILMDLRMSQILHESSRLADHLLAAADRSDLVKSRKSKQAEFQVLRSLAMPSALVEIAYLSHDRERKLLQDPLGRRRMAAVLVNGLMAWRRDDTALAQLSKGAPPGWGAKYSVRRGDSLWGLARKHGTTVGEISRRNNLESRGINVGQILRLPGRGVSR